jgi:hypothetical protein
LKSFNLIYLNAKEIGRMTGQGRWEDEIVKRIWGNISEKYYTDIILPIAFDGV